MGFLMALLAGLGGTVALRGVGGAVARRAAPLALGGAAGAGATALGLLAGGGDQPVRRRRRRFLTATDRADIAFLEATLGRQAAKQLAAIRLARL